MVTETELKSKTVVQLKEMLTEKALDVTGKKQELIDRLLAAETATAPAEGASTAAPAAEPVAAAVSEPAAAPAASTSTTAAASPTKTKEEIEAREAEEKAKREARAAKFGGVPESEKPAPRADFTNSKKGKAAAAAASKPAPSLDKPLGDGKAASKPSSPVKPEAVKATPAAASPATKVVDAAEEERRKKRAERFAPAGAPEAKKPKV